MLTVDWLNILQYNPDYVKLHLSDLTERMPESKDIILNILKKKDEFLKEIPISEITEEMCQISIKNNIENFQYLPQHFRNQETIHQFAKKCLPNKYPDHAIHLLKEIPFLMRDKFVAKYFFKNFLHNVDEDIINLFPAEVKKDMYLPNLKNWKIFTIVLALFITYFLCFLLDNKLNESIKTIIILLIFSTGLGFPILFASEYPFQLLRSKLLFWKKDK